VPVNRYNTDYSILGSSRVEPLMRRIRNEMPIARIPVENSKGECNLGQQEVTLHHAPALTMADNHTLYKHGVKEISSQLGVSSTFMAKYNQAEGNSCHIHLSLENADGSNAFAADEAMFNSFLQGLIVTLRELTLLHAPQINSYKRFQKGSFAPTAVAWGEDNRTCALRTVGHDRGRRIELRVPGADVNPYLTVAGIIAGGLHGIENELQLEPETTGNGYLTDSPHVPSTLAEARDLFAASAIASEAFGEEVVAHYVNCAQVEIDAFNSAVTDWELKRGFERL
jgi:glutamine synthetase